MSIRTGLSGAITKSISIGGVSFAMFLKSQRQWKSNPLSENEIKEFKSTLEKYNFPFEQILPHGPYLINLGNPDPEKFQKSYQSNFIPFHFFFSLLININTTLIIP